MPWSPDDVDSHRKGLTDKQKETWCEVANKALKRCEDKGGKDCEGSAIRQANSLFEESTEAKTKTVDGEGFPASDFLVVEDPDKPSTFHLQVKRHGTPDHGLMGGAKAALTSPDGHRGNVYEGPGKAAAIKKLKALYKAEDMEWAEEAEPEPGGPERCKCPECGHAVPKERGVPCRSVECPECGAKMVADVSEAAVVGQFRRLLFGALAEFQGSTDEFTNRVRAGFYSRFSKRYTDMPMETDMWVRDVLVDDPAFGDALVVDSGGTLYVVAYEEEGDEEVTFADRDEWKEVVLAYRPVAESIGEGLAERASGSIVGVVESENGKGPLYVDLVPIRPGWGNSRDNHYYTAEAVKGAAAIWKGAKMYATDHVQEEKNVLTEVSEVVESPVSHTEDGIPVVRAAVINPLFADVIRMRQAAGILGNLECSIVARGLVEKEEFEDPATGRTGHRVTEILADDAGIDWVTRAGAGGHALPLSEASEAAEEDDMPEEKKEDVAETEEKELHEGDEGAQDNVGEETPPEETKEDDPQPLTEARVAEILAGTDLSEPAREMLARSTYGSEDELNTAVEGLREIVKAAARSGQPFGMGGAEPQPEQGMKEREIAGHKRFNETLRRHGRPELPLPAALRD